MLDEEAGVGVEEREVASRTAESAREQLDQQLLQTQMNSLISNDLKLLHKHQQSKGVLEEHPLYALHNEIFGPKECLGNDHSNMMYTSCNRKHEGEQSMSSSPREGSLTEEVKDTYLQLQQQMGLASFSQQHYQQQQQQQQAEASSAGGINSASLPLTTQYDYGYPLHTSAPMNGTGSLSSTNSNVDNATTSSDNGHKNKKAQSRIKEQYDRDTNSTTDNYNNHDNTPCFCPHWRVITVAISCLTFLFTMTVSLFEMSAAYASPSVLSVRKKKLLLLLPFAITVTSLIYFGYYYNI